VGDDKQAREERAARLREEIEAIKTGQQKPGSPREFTDQEASKQEEEQTSEEHAGDERD
jgi:hypothetical protein